jgi:polyisoprenoid-binding protein YceI
MRRSLSFVLLLAFALPVAAAINAPSGNYGLDKTHAYITLTYSHLGFSNPHLGFNDFDVKLQLNANEPHKSTFEVVIEAASVDSRVAEFDEHLVGERFFDVANHPKILFASRTITMTSDATATIVGDLTIKGITKPVTLEATLNKAAMHPMLKRPTLGVSAVGALRRSDWDLGYAVPMVTDEVQLYLSVEMPLVDEAAP